MTVKEAGAVGMILIDELEDHVANHFAVPGVTVGKAMGDKILSYVKRTRLSKLTIGSAFYWHVNLLSKVNSTGTPVQ